MPRTTRHLLGLVVVLAMTSCSAVTGPDSALDANVSVNLKEISRRDSAIVTLTLRNTSAKTQLVFLTCDFNQYTLLHWNGRVATRPTASIACIALPTVIKLSPGEIRSLSSPWRVITLESFAPDSAIPAGRYRLVTTVTYQEESTEYKPSRKLRRQSPVVKVM
jgi:hypothetical protein